MNRLFEAGYLRAVLSLCLGLSILVFSRLGLAEQPRPEGNKKARPFAVLEVFTSENSVRCDKAIRLASIISEEAKTTDENLFVLTYHVDYLNTPAWKDRLSKKSFSDRQMQYVRAFRQGRAAPGQVVINGQYHAVADKLAVVRRKIKRALSVPARAKLDLQKSISGDGASVLIHFTVRGLERIRREFFYFHTALVEESVARQVTDGPNEGVSFTHRHVVRLLEKSRFAGKTGKGSAEIVLPRAMKKEEGRVVCFVQDPRNGQILGAESFKLRELEKTSDRPSAERTN